MIAYYHQSSRLILLYMTLYKIGTFLQQFRQKSL